LWDVARRLHRTTGFKVRLHHPPNAKPLGDSTEFIQLEVFAAPRVRQRSSATSRPILFLNRKQSATGTALRRGDDGVAL